jgi:hypothetical protein
MFLYDSCCQPVHLSGVGSMPSPISKKYSMLIELTHRWNGSRRNAAYVPRNTSTYCSSILGLPTCRSDARVTDKLCRIARGPVAFPRTAPASACRWMQLVDRTYVHRSVVPGPTYAMHECQLMHCVRSLQLSSELLCPHARTTPTVQSKSVRLLFEQPWPDPCREDPDPRYCVACLFLSLGAITFAPHVIVFMLLLNV